MPQHSRKRIERGLRNLETSYSWENLASLRKGASFFKKIKNVFYLKD